MRGCADKLELGVVLLEIVVHHLVLVILGVDLAGLNGDGGNGDGSLAGSRAEGGGHDKVVLLVVIIRRVGVVDLILGAGLLLVDLGDVLGPLDTAVLLLGGAVGTADGLVEPALLLTLGIGKLEHQVVEEVSVSDKQAEVVIGLGSLAGQLAAGLVSQVVGLCDGHVLLEGALAERVGW